MLGHKTAANSQDTNMAATRKAMDPVSNDPLSAFMEEDQSMSAQPLIKDESQAKVGETNVAVRAATVEYIIAAGTTQEWKMTAENLAEENCTLKDKVKLLEEALVAQKASSDEKVTSLELELQRVTNLLRAVEVPLYMFPELVSKAMAVIEAGTHAGTEAGTQAASRSPPAPSTSSRHVDEQTNKSSAKESGDEDEEEDEDAFHALKDAFPIKKENFTKLSPVDERKFVLNLIGTLYSRQYLRLHKKSGTKATHGDDLKIPIPREQYVQIQDAICSMLKVKLTRHRLPPKLELAISQKFNQVRPTAADKRKLRHYWKMQNTQNP
ncbi:hypothetical protein OUZ56_003213 [Daphnia magna]|uniref:BEN domain-containing protein n=1 Tax=Daphnia magna TaxID=35525 RepID=A0ABR0A8H7_9CRUS|nr:hypothetical protein OUZ56_003213 [Daphnia magna]